MSVMQLSAALQSNGAGWQNLRKQRIGRQTAARAGTTTPNLPPTALQLTEPPAQLDRCPRPLCGCERPNSSLAAPPCQRRSRGAPQPRRSRRTTSSWPLLRPQAPQSQRHGGFAQESRARLSLRRRYPRRCRRVRRSSGLLGADGAGLQLLLGPGTSGFDVTFLFLVHDAEVSWPRSTRGAPSARPSHPCARPSHPAHPTHGSRTFPPPCTAHAPPCTPRFHLTPYCPRVRRSSILPFYLDQGRCRRAEAARRRRRGPCGPGGRLGARGGRGRARGGALGRAMATPKVASDGPKRATAH